MRSWQAGRDWPKPCSRRPDERAVMAPALSCDCHIHVFAATDALERSAEAYRALQRRLGLSRAVVVQASAYGFDNRVTLAAIAALGAADTRGTAIVARDVSDAELTRLTEGGIRGARLHVMPNWMLAWEDVAPIADRIAAFGWHVQLQMDGALLPEREAALRRLPTPVVIDHLGKFLQPVTVADDCFQSVLRLLDTGRVWFKLSAGYEISRSGPPGYEDVSALAIAAIRHAPERMLWGSNWPHIGVPVAPDDAGELDLLRQWVPDAAVRHRILVENPAAFYGFDQPKAVAAR